MLVLGVILVLLALVVLLFVVLATSGLPAMEIDWTIVTAQLTPLQLYLLGATTILVLAVGAAMLYAGLKKQNQKRAEVKRLRKEVGDDGHGGTRPASSPSVSDRAGEPRSSTQTGADATGTDPRAATTGPGSPQRGTPSPGSTGSPAPGTRPPSDPRRS